MGLQTASRINRRALFGGGGERTAPLTTTWDISGNGKWKCLVPVKNTLVGHQPLDDYIVGEEPGRLRQYIDLTARCRKCAHCLKLRGRTWATRMTLECELATRTWFGTITFAPAYRLLIDNRAIVREGLSGQRWDALSDDEKFVARHRVINVELTKAVKRLREYARGPLRLVMVAERHKDGFPHYHALVHESHKGGVHERELRRAFPAGFSQWKLVEHSGRAAWYVSKYLMKSALARVRASSDYGSLDRVEADAPWKSDPTKRTVCQVEQPVQRAPGEPLDPPPAQAQAQARRVTAP